LKISESDIENLTDFQYNFFAKINQKGHISKFFKNPVTKKEVETNSALADEFCRIPLNFTSLMRQNLFSNLQAKQTGSIEMSLRILSNTIKINNLMRQIP
jgi:hypothetical protein